VTLKKAQKTKYLSYPQPVFVVGTYDRQKKPNMMTVALGGMCSHNPPCFAISVRPTTYSHQNIIDRQAFTVNIPSKRYLKHVDYAGLVSGRDTDKFAVCGLTAVESERVDAPYIDEFPTVAECKLRHTLDLGSHTMFIGEIMSIKGEERILTDLSHLLRNLNDIPDMVKAEGIVYAFAGDGRYYCDLGEPLEKAYSVGRELIE
jgi:flavin reductase (DIM6/NTAB) family NADH-FMN oxidoreductase RutF